MSVEVLLPRLSDTMDEGVLVQWLCATGDAVTVGQEIAEVDTDKATVTLEAEAEGVLQCLVSEGTAVAVGAPIGRIGTAEEAAAAPPPTDTSTAVQKTTATTVEAPAQQPEAAVVAPAVGTPAGTTERVIITPVARRIATAAGVRDFAMLGPGSGPRGRIHKADVERYLARREGAPRTGTPQDETLEPTRLQALIAKRMVAAKSEVPHYYLTASVSIGAVEELRRSAAEHMTVRPSMTDFIVLACATALRAVPEVNSAWIDDRIVRRGGVHVGLAVALDDGGLVVPVLRDVDTLTLGELAEQRADLVERARARKLNPRELEGGTFSVSNLGSFGIDEFHAIVNPPESGILAVGGIRQEVAMADGELTVRPVIRISLSADHRVYSGATAAQFLSAVRHGLEHPISLLVGGSSGPDGVERKLK